MKLRYLVIAIAVLAGASVANAQTESTGNDVFVGGGVGIISPLTPGFNTPSLYINLQVGKYITPVWGVRASIGGPFISLDANNGNAYYADGTIRSFSNKLFGELNLDGMINISNIFAEDLAKFNFYVFVGPTVNFSSEGSRFVESGLLSDGIYQVEESNAFKVRVGATAGLGLSYNFTRAFALGVEGRFGVTPSVFGDGDKYRKAEGTTRISLNGVWTIGGANGKAARAAKAAAAAGYISPEQAQAMVDEAVRNRDPRIEERIVEKPVEKVVEVERVIDSFAPTAVFFALGKTNLSQSEMVRVKLYAEAINACDRDVKFVIEGYADKATGSAKRNQVLSEGRAKTVYDALVAEGVDPDRLEMEAYGGVQPMFFNNFELSRTAIIKVK